MDDVFAAYGKGAGRRRTKQSTIDYALKQLSAKDKAIQEKRDLVKYYLANVEYDLKEYLQGKNGKTLRFAIDSFEKSCIISAESVRGLIEKTFSNYAKLDYDWRWQLFETCSNIIMYVKMANDVDPIEDPMPWDKDGPVTTDMVLKGTLFPEKYGSVDQYVRRYYLW